MEHLWHRAAQISIYCIYISNAIHECAIFVSLDVQYNNKRKKIYRPIFVSYIYIFFYPMYGSFSMTNLQEKSVWPKMCTGTCPECLAIVATTKSNKIILPFNSSPFGFVSLWVQSKDECHAKQKNILDAFASVAPYERASKRICLFQYGAALSQTYFWPHLICFSSGISWWSSAVSRVWRPVWRATTTLMSRTPVSCLTSTSTHARLRGAGPFARRWAGTTSRTRYALDPFFALPGSFETASTSKHFNTNLIKEIRCLVIKIWKHWSWKHCSPLLAGPESGSLFIFFLMFSLKEAILISMAGLRPKILSAFSSGSVWEPTQLSAFSSGSVWEPTLLEKWQCGVLVVFLTFNFVSKYIICCGFRWNLFGPWLQCYMDILWNSCWCKQFYTMFYNINRKHTMPFL